ncbi:MAG: sigma 54-interacting transcriptional regulator [Desulfocapsaceae bacterium]|jgi:PAS domain S-box-containing protein|nr:sigma 54-interacting transcriptional regulator [Desulfocapsaceae bacterium]
MECKAKPSGSILVVDDEASLRDTFHFFLSREGYEPVITVAGFKEALSILRNQPIDLVLSDIVLEGNTGIDLLKYTRQMGIDCPFIVITGFPDVDTASEAVRLGAFDYISKPVDKETLLKSVKLALRHRYLENEKNRAETEREQYRLFLDKVFKSVTDAIIIVDARLKILKLNAAARHLFANLLPGVSEGASLSVSIASEEFSSLRADLLRVLKTGQEITEHRFECKTLDGTQKILSICTSPFQENNSDYHGAVIVIRDMSIRSQHNIRHRNSFHRFIGGSEPMQSVYTTIENVGRVDTTVLITGESGTGKELAAEALHRESPRKNKALIKVDCTAMPENLLESELFGHKKGAFTGADKDRKGHIIQADGGTLFLDEIGEISALTQLRLLRFLQEKTFYPVGSDTEIVVDTRVITATNVNLKEKVLEGTFREDLYFRLRVIDVFLPPLRHRVDDIPLLANHFIKIFSNSLNKIINGLSDNVIEALTNYDWPGNVRELEHVIERAVVLCQGPTITIRDLPDDLFNMDVPEASSVRTFTTAASVADQAAGEQEDAVAGRVLEVLKKCGGNKAKAARLLGIDRSTLYRKIKEHDIDLSAIALE